LNMDQPTTVHEGLDTPPLSARPTPLIEVSVDTACAQRFRQGKAASFPQLDTPQTSSLILSRPPVAFDNHSVSSLTESLSDPEPIPLEADSTEDHGTEHFSDGACVDPASSPVRRQHLSTSSAFLRPHLLRLLFVFFLNRFRILPLAPLGRRPISGEAAKETARPLGADQIWFCLPQFHWSRTDTMLALFSLLAGPTRR
jgi:hypothetical protein